MPLQKGVMGNQHTGKAVRVNLIDFKSIPMQTFHLTWMAFFVSFFGWFAIAPLMPLIREDLGLSKEQIGNTIIASVAATIFVRLIIGWLCDRLGPRRTYTGLLLLGSLPVMCVGLADSYGSFLFFRLAISAVGASFVITQYHTSLMFAPNCIGTANATTAGWGNLGGGITQMVMPLILAAVLSFGVDEAWGWRVSMVVPGVLMFIMGIVYFRVTKDSPQGNLDVAALREQKGQARGSFRAALKDRRVWLLSGIYAGSFGMELTMNNIAALYFTDQFQVTVTSAGLLAGLFGIMNLFARSLGGILSDRLARTGGLKGRIGLLGILLFMGGLLLMVFSRMTILPFAVLAMMTFGLFVKMANGATYAVVPFVNKRAIGAVAGIVGACGNLGAVAFGFLFRSELDYASAFLALGIIASVLSLCALGIRFSEADEEKVRQIKNALGVAPVIRAT